MVLFSNLIPKRFQLSFKSIKWVKRIHIPRRLHRSFSYLGTEVKDSIHAHHICFQLKTIFARQSQRISSYIQFINRIIIISKWNLDIIKNTRRHFSNRTCFIEWLGKNQVRIRILGILVVGECDSIMIHVKISSLWTDSEERSREDFGRYNYFFILGNWQRFLIIILGLSCRCEDMEPGPGGRWSFQNGYSFSIILLMLMHLPMVSNIHEPDEVTEFSKKCSLNFRITSSLESIRSLIRLFGFDRFLRNSVVLSIQFRCIYHGIRASGRSKIRE